MRLEVLGCSGGIGKGLHTTSLRVDGRLLVDAGTGLATLPHHSLARAESVLITHSHFDHIACLPMLCDLRNTLQAAPLVVYGLPETLQALKSHVFNNTLWPDFTRIPTDSAPYLRYEPLSIGEVRVIDGLRVEVLPAVHSVPAVGYLIGEAPHSIAFSGDTTHNPALWQRLNVAQPSAIIIEAAFRDEEYQLAQISGHLCPRMLAKDLAAYEGHARLYATHPKPGEESIVAEQLASHLPGRTIRLLQSGEVIDTAYL
jgi:ribonuclease BN (tRNA processing enzyme)